MDSSRNSACEVCGTPLTVATRGRPRRFCSPACRSHAYRNRRHADQVNAATKTPATRSEQTLTAATISAAAIGLADQDGIDAVSMRRIAAELQAGPMSLYRHVPDKDALLDLVVQAVYAERPLPVPGPSGWRARLELSARQEWSIYLEHPWLASVVAATARPVIAPALMAYTDWRMQAVEGYDLDLTERLQVAVALSSTIQGPALALARSQRSTGTDEDWLATRATVIAKALSNDQLPQIAGFGQAELDAVSPDRQFDFSLRCTLDGIEAFLVRRPRPSHERLKVTLGN